MKSLSHKSMSIIYSCVLVLGASNLYGQSRSSALIDDATNYIDSIHPELLTACERRADVYKKLNLVFEVWSQGKLYGSVYTSKDYSVIITSDGITCLSGYGGFVLHQTNDDPQQYRLEAAVTSSDIRLRTSSYEAFLQRISFERFGIPIFNSSVGESISPMDYFDRDGFSDIQASLDKSNNLSILYFFENQGANAGPLAFRGKMTFSPSYDYGLLTHNMAILPKGSNKQVGTRYKELTYYNSTDTIPVCLPKSMKTSLILNNNPSNTIELVYKNYHIEEFPEEQLHLAYYGLPNELVEDETWSNRNYLWIGLVAVLFLGIVVVLVRHRRGRASRSSKS